MFSIFFRPFGWKSNNRPRSQNDLLIKRSSNNGEKTWRLSIQSARKMLKWITVRSGLMVARQGPCISAPRNARMHSRMMMPCTISLATTKLLAYSQLLAIFDIRAIKFMVFHPFPCLSWFRQGMNRGISTGFSIGLNTVHRRSGLAWEKNSFSFFINKILQDHINHDEDKSSGQKPNIDSIICLEDYFLAPG